MMCILHLSSSTATSSQGGTLRATASWSRHSSLPSFPTFLCGDLNFVERVEDSTSASPLLPPRHFIEAWHRLIEHLEVVEVPSDAHTFFHVTEDPLSPHSHTSRLDRIYIPSSLYHNPSIQSSLFSPHHQPFYQQSQQPRTTFLLRPPPYRHRLQQLLQTN